MLNQDFFDLEVEPVSDEILAAVLGGLGEEDGITNSCSKTDCSNKKTLDPTSG